MRQRDMQTAERFGFLSRVQDFEKALLEIEGITGDKVDFDLDGWNDSIRQIIIVPAYHITSSSLRWFEDRAAMINRINETAARFGLHRSVDSIEDYGAHLYIVFECNDTWP